MNITNAFSSLGLLLLVLLSAAIGTILTYSSSYTHTNNDVDASIQYNTMGRRMLSSPSLLPDVASSDSDSIPEDVHVLPPSAYSHLIIQYHKTGHVLAYSLTNLIKEDDDTLFNYVQHDPLLKRGHDETTKCPHMDLKPGMMYVQAGPDFFCDLDVLVEELLHGGKQKRGIKIIHLVRNPFHLAVSNYKYHSQNPTPERWVKGYDACKAQEDSYYPELMMPTLGAAGVLKDEDFDSILDICHSLFQTQPGLQKKHYYSHLQKLDPIQGLLLATTILMRGVLGDITRMANNIIKLQQLQQLEAQANVAQHHLVPQRRIQVLTLAMDEFNRMPKETARRFVDFLVSDTSSPEVVDRIARQYKRNYLEMKNSGNHMHITKGSGDNAMLEASLREHELFGKILSNIEHVVEESLG